MHRRLLAASVALAALGAMAGAGCAELGVVGDGTTISVGRPSRGQIVDGVRLPDRGEGYFTRPVWRARNQRYGTDELIDLIVAVSRRMAAAAGEVRLVVADLSGRGGGPAPLWHRSHQSGRDVDLVYYMRDAAGKPFEADAMRVFGDDGVARDGSGITVDVPRTWRLVRELVTAREAIVQWVFMYEPIAAKLIEHAQSVQEPEDVIARARKALKQPGDSARHDDHMHVRVYCTPADKAYGCADYGPMELFAEREAELAASPVEVQLVTAMLGTPASLASTSPAAGIAQPIAGAAPALGSLGRLLRMRVDLMRRR